MSYARTIIRVPWAFLHARHNMPALRLGTPHVLVKTITYGNGVTSEYEYDDAGRMTQAKHTELGGSEPFLQLDYDYDPRGLLWEVYETRQGASSHTAFEYDYLGRLIAEARLGDVANDLSYE